MKIRRTHNAAEIRSILSDPELQKVGFAGLDLSYEDMPWEEIAEQKNVYFLVYGTPVQGLFMFNPVNGITYDMHVNIPRSNRGNHVVQLAKAAMSWMFTNVNSCKKLVATVPTAFPKVMMFASKIGFRVEGVSLDSIEIDSKVYDRYFYGVEREV